MAVNYPNSIQAVLPEIPTPSFSKTVYVNALSPATATIFDLNNPPVTNDNSLKANSNNIYITTDGKTYTYNSSTDTYSTYTYPTTVAHGVLARLQANQSIAHATGVNLINLTTVSNTAGSGWNSATGQFTVQRAGWYTTTLSVEFNASSYVVNSPIQAIINKNSISYFSNTHWMEVGATNLNRTTLLVTGGLYLAVDDVIRPFVYNESGSTKTIHTSPIRNFFSIIENR
jgi:hypothetical protein